MRRHVLALCLVTAAGLSGCTDDTTDDMAFPRQLESLEGPSGWARDTEAFVALSGQGDVAETDGLVAVPGTSIRGTAWSIPIGSPADAEPACSVLRGWLDDIAPDLNQSPTEEGSDDTVSFVDQCVDAVVDGEGVGTDGTFLTIEGSVAGSSLTTRTLPGVVDGGAVLAVAVQSLRS